MRAEASAENLTWGVDTLATLGVLDFRALYAARVRWRAGYIEKMTLAELTAQLQEGVAFMPVTYALDFDAAAQIAKLHALGTPHGVTVFLDVEGMNLDAASLTLRINAWARSMIAGGFEAGLYVGAACPLSDAQLYALVVTRYWHSCSRVPDPLKRGCCVRQLRPNDVTPTRVDVDVDIVEPDYQGGLPTLAAP